MDQLDEYKDNRAKCTKEQPWDGKTLPVLHVEADFIDDSNTLLCPVCKYCWSLGPDV
jgi:hypothetical protein